MKSNLHIATVGVDNSIALGGTHQRGGVAQLERHTLIAVQVDGREVLHAGHALGQVHACHLKAVLSLVGHADDFGVHLLANVHVAEVVAIHRQFGHGCCIGCPLLHGHVVHIDSICNIGEHLVDKGNLHLLALPVTEINLGDVVVPSANGEHHDTTFTQHLFVLDAENGLSTIQVAIGDNTHLQVVLRIVVSIHGTDEPRELQHVGVTQVEFRRKQNLFAWTCTVGTCGNGTVASGTTGTADCRA